MEICRGGAGRQFCKSAENAGGEGRTRRVRRARAGSIKGGNYSSGEERSEPQLRPQIPVTHHIKLVLSSSEFDHLLYAMLTDVARSIVMYMAH